MTELAQPQPQAEAQLTQAEALEVNAYVTGTRAYAARVRLAEARAFLAWAVERESLAAVLYEAYASLNSDIEDLPTKVEARLAEARAFKGWAEARVAQLEIEANLAAEAEDESDTEIEANPESAIRLKVYDLALKPRA